MSLWAITTLEVMHMRIRRLIVVLVLGLIGAMVLAGPVFAAKLDVAQQGGRLLSTTLTGEAEIPGPGDPDGSGFATITVNPGQELLCYELSVAGIAPATAAHVHFGSPGEAGPVVVGLAPPTSGFSSGCVFVDRGLAKAIIKNPSLYYVNVHNDPYPGGALRGQLSK
jgi:hypothetical protein